MSSFVQSVQQSQMQADVYAESKTRRLEWGMCFIVALTTLILWCFTDRNLISDELGLFNPTFMAYSTGKVTYPMHGQWDYMTVHPPFLYWTIGMLMRLGLSPVQAGGLHCWVLAMAILMLVLTSRFELRLKLCIPAALLMTVCFFGQYTLRPEVPILLSWLAGVMALENSRTNAWRTWPLFLAGFFLAYASGLHYWSFLACVSSLPYAAAMARDLGLRGTAARTPAFMGGAALFAIPFLLFFLIPEWPKIQDMLRNTSSTGSIAAAYASHLKVIGHFLESPGSWLLPSWLLFQPVYLLRVVPICLALGILLCFRQTRLLVVASLPLPLFVVLCIQRKAGPLYLLPELHLWFLSLLVVAHTLCGKVAGITSWWKWPALGPATAALALSAYALLLGGHKLATLNLALKPDVLTVYRAAARDLVGPRDLLIFNSNSRWYTGGGTDLCFYTVWGQTWEDFARLLPKQQTTLLFNDDWLGNQRCAVPIPHWYLDGHVNLSGFTLGGGDFLSVFVSTDPKAVRGYWQANDRTLHSFREDPAGDYVFVTLKTERAALVPPGDGWASIRLEDPRQSSLVLCVRLYTLADYHRHEATLRHVGTVRDAVRGTLNEVDTRALLAEHRRNDRPIRFHRTLAEAAAALVSMDAGSSGQIITLKPLQDRPKVQTSPDGTGYELHTNHSQDEWQMEAELTVTPNTLYRFQFDLEIQRGGLFVHVFDPTVQRYLYSFNRPDPQGRKTECFLFHSGSANRIRLGIANNRPNGRPGCSQATIANIQFAAVP